jgi:hypothetical protein
VRPSSIPAAGYGLFATHDHPADKVNPLSVQLQYYSRTTVANQKCKGLEMFPGLLSATIPAPGAVSLHRYHTHLQERASCGQGLRGALFELLHVTAGSLNCSVFSPRSYFTVTV